MVASALLLVALASSADDVTQKTDTKTDTAHTRSSTVTNAKGETTTRNATVTNDKDNATRTRDVTHTNGETRVTSVACDKSVGHCTLDVPNSGSDRGKH
jgi:hypothetical protein